MRAGGEETLHDMGKGGGQEGGREGGAALHLQAPVLSLEGLTQLAPAEQAVRNVAGGRQGKVVHGR
jgi:hypothetical protein